MKKMFQNKLPSCIRHQKASYYCPRTSVQDKIIPYTLLTLLDVSWANSKLEYAQMKKMIIDKEKKKIINRRKSKILKCFTEFRYAGQKIKKKQLTSYWYIYYDAEAIPVCRSICCSTLRNCKYDYY